MVAYILADFFQKNVEFVARGILKTADFKIGGEYWELKALLARENIMSSIL